MPPRAKAQSATPATTAGPHGGQASIRKAYEAHGVQHFYSSHGARYTNPHEAQIFAALAQLLEATPAAVWLGLRELQPEAAGADDTHDDDDDASDDGADHDDGIEPPTRRGGVQTSSRPGPGAGGAEAELAGSRSRPGPEAGGAEAELAPPPNVGPCSTPSRSGRGPPDMLADGAAAAAVAAAAAAAAAVVSGLVPPVRLRVLDLACGSGEATAALLHWNQRHPLLQGGTTPPPAVRPPADPPAGAAAASSAAPRGAAAAAATASGQHAAPAQRQQHTQARAAGAAATSQRQLQQQQYQHQQHPLGRAGGRGPARGGGGHDDVVLPYDLRITACDPYTGAAYMGRTGCAALSWSFEDIADGCLADWEPEPTPGRGCESGSGSGPGSGSGSGPGSRPLFDLAVCSFALHLCDPSRLYGTLTALSLAVRWLAVLAPHKRPQLGSEMGWVLVGARRVERTHVRLYRSLRVPEAEGVEEEAAV